jgi:hypothetical protein
MPPYLDNHHRFLFSRRFNPEEKSVPEHHGWDSLAELFMDFSGFLDKPDNPTIDPTDLYALGNSRQVARDLGARGWENYTVSNLEAVGREDLIPQFKQDMQAYRKAVKGVVALWRKRGLL